jgi:Flp pilus assembly protein TadD
MGRPLRFVLAAALLLVPLVACVKPTPVERAMSLARQHREPEGILVLRAQLAAHPEDMEARRLLIRLLAVASDLAAARDEVTAMADRLPPGDPAPWIELGHALELVHQFDDAMAAYETAAEKAPASPEGPRQAGMRAARWGQWEDASSWLEEAVKRGGGDARGSEGGGVLARSRDGGARRSRLAGSAGRLRPGSQAPAWLGGR